MSLLLITGITFSRCSHLPNRISTSTNNRQITSWADVCEADKVRKFAAIHPVLVKYLLSHPQENYQTIERRFRETSCITHLIAADVRNHPLFPTWKAKNVWGIEKAFFVLVSTLDEAGSLAERAKHSPSAEINEERLKDSGDMKAANKNMIDFILEQAKLRPGESIEVNDEVFEALKELVVMKNTQYKDVSTEDMTTEEIEIPASSSSAQAPQVQDDAPMEDIEETTLGQSCSAPPARSPNTRRKNH